MSNHDQIILKGMEFYGYHGLLPAERELGQWFVLDLELTLDLSGAGEGDDIGQTVDYGEVYRRIRSIVEGPPVDLIETLAFRVMDACFAFDRIEHVKVTVKKPQAPLGGPLEYAAVQIQRNRRSDR